MVETNQPAASATTPSGAQPGATVDYDLTCANCRYNLRSLPWAGRCPECGAAVRASLPPSGFRFKKMSALFRVRRGLAILVIGVLLRVLPAVALCLVLRYYYAVPRTLRLAAVCASFDGSQVACLLTVLGLVVITYPFGRGGDRFLRRLGVAVLILAPLSFTGILAGYLGNRWGGTPFGLSWNAYEAIASPFVYGLSLAHLLVWVYLLARVRADKEFALWCITLLVLAIQAFVLIKGIARYVCFLVAWSSHSGQSDLLIWSDSFDNWLGGWERQINGLAWIVTMLGVWYYLRKLGSAVQKPG